MAKDTTEIDIRRVLVAQALTQLGQTVESGETAAIVYPPAHWFGETKDLPGISTYLENDQLRKEKLSYYSRFKKARIFQPLFRTREYKL
jgi:hypothetical protein